MNVVAMAATLASNSTPATSIPNKNSIYNRSNIANNNFSVDNVKQIKMNLNNSNDIESNQYRTTSSFPANNNNNSNTTQLQQQQLIQELNKFNLDDLVWAKLNNHPWWPCKIVKCKSNLPNECDTYVKLNGEYNYFLVKYYQRFQCNFFKGNKLMYFVEFFGSSNERSWTFDSNLFKYDGIESFKTYAQDQVDRAITKSDKEKLAERFQLKVALNRREHWEEAIKQADLYLEAIRSNKKSSNDLKLSNNNKMSTSLISSKNLPTKRKVFHIIYLKNIK